jgi:RoxA-like, cytochrome c-like
MMRLPHRPLRFLRPHALGLVAILAAACNLPPAREYPAEIVYLDQGWTDVERANYYYTPQGTELHGLRYEWFRYLELPFSEQRLADPSFLVRFGFLYDPEQFHPGYEPPPYNPANLPVGFTYHADRNGGFAVLDITCAACHTGQLEYRGKALRVDGGQAMHAFASLRPGGFIPTLLVSLYYTYTNPFKFDRFARNVLGSRYPKGKGRLRLKVGHCLAAFSIEGYHSIAKRAYPTEEGYGRIDALDHIANTVFGDDLDPANYRVANAPVSYPHVWDIWKFDWVQWNGSVAQPMGRNVGEALGVKAQLALVGPRGDRLKKKLYDSSVLVRELHCIETTLWQLKPPIWNEEVLPPIDADKAARGKVLFEQSCKPCHGPYVYLNGRAPPAAGDSARYFVTDPAPTPLKPIEWRMTVVPTTEIGTDPSVVDNFLDYRFNLSLLDFGEPLLQNIDSAHALNFITARVIERQYKRLALTREQRLDFDGFGRPLGVRPNRGYKARPLHGIWATPPFLHNGSVPTIYDLLLPEEERPRSFYVGSREFDPVRIGYSTEPGPGAFLFDTTLPGNANTGHQFRDDGGAGVIGRGFSDQERFEIIEYLKVLGNPRYGYQEDSPWPGPAKCPPTLQGPAGQARRDA